MANSVVTQASRTVGDILVEAGSGPGCRVTPAGGGVAAAGGQGAGD